MLVKKPLPLSDKKNLNVQNSHSIHGKITFVGMLVTLGIIFGDIGTSPLYVLKAIIGDNPITEDVLLGGISCIFWTITLQTTLKYIILTLRADNKGEGGIFALYTLVKRMKVKWLIFPAMIGGSALLADGIITPSISVSSAIEGLRYFNPGIPTVPIVMVIITALFVVQQFGTKAIGKMFGPVMLVWFSMLGILGIMSLTGNWSVLKALNPYYAYNLLVRHPEGFWLLGAVFLCTTGAESLYSDLGHCGKKNIRVTWGFVKLMLLLNYFGQGAWLMEHLNETLNGRNPFYSLMPEKFLWVGIIIATSATIVASQALISASFTLINEAMRLNFWPKVKIKYPTEMKGQLYIPSINWILCAGCLGIVYFFKESSSMEAAYGLTINIDMIMTSTLLIFYMILKKYNPLWIIGFVLTYGIIEFAFLAANLDKFVHGGWVSLLISCMIIFIMYVWYQAKIIRNRYVEFTKLDEFVPLIKDLSNDLSIPKYSTHLIYLTSANEKDEIEKKVIYSILQKRPKRADIYWFVHVDVKDEPYRHEYKVTEIAKDDIIRVDFKLGFRIAPRINLMFRKVVQNMVEKGEVDITSRYQSLSKNKVIGDFRFIVLEKYVSSDCDLPIIEKLIMDVYEVIKRFTQSEDKAFGLDTSSVFVEKFPMIIGKVREVELTRIE